MTFIPGEAAGHLTLEKGIHFNCFRFCTAFDDDRTAHIDAVVHFVYEDEDGVKHYVDQEDYSTTFFKLWSIHLGLRPNGDVEVIEFSDPDR